MFVSFSDFILLIALVIALSCLKLASRSAMLSDNSLNLLFDRRFFIKILISSIDIPLLLIFRLS